MKDAMKVGLAALLCVSAGVGAASAESMSGNGWVCTQYSFAGTGQAGMSGMSGMEAVLRGQSKAVVAEREEREVWLQQRALMIRKY